MGIIVLIRVYFQDYCARFYVLHATSEKSGYATFTINVVKMAKVACLANLVVATIVHDTHRQVHCQIEAAIDRQIRTSDPLGMDSQHAIARSVALNNWADVQNPFACNHTTPMVLLRALRHNPDERRLALPLDGRIMTYSQLGNVFCVIGQTPRRFVTPPPFWSGGRIRPVLEVAIPAMLRLLHGGASEPHTAVVRAFEVSLQEKGVDYLPTAPSDVSEGTSITRWFFLSGPNRRASKEQREAHLAIVQITHDQSHASWSAHNIAKIPKYINRRVRPDDWRLQDAGVTANGDPQVWDIYRWVDTHLDMAKPLHQLAIFVGLIFPYALPFVSTPLDVTVTSDQSFQDAYQSLPWLRDRKRSSNIGGGRSYPTVVSTLIIALYEPRSPLRILLDAGYDPGSQWKYKHSESLSRIALQLQHSCLLIAAGHVDSEQVTPKTLAHMGLIRSMRPIRGWNRYDAVWRLWSDADIQRIHASMRNNLQGPYPIYTFFESLFGTLRAQEVANRNEWRRPTTTV